MSLAVTCHLHSWQKDWDLLHATAVTWGWNRYGSKSQCIKLTLEMKTLLLLLLGLKPMTFQSPVWHSTTDLFPSAAMLYCVHAFPVLTGGKPNDRNLIPIFKWISFDCSWYLSSPMHYPSGEYKKGIVSTLIIMIKQPEPVPEEKPPRGGVLWMQKNVSNPLLRIETYQRFSPC